MRTLPGALALSMALAPCLWTAPEALAAGATATVEFKDREGKVLGTASLRETTNGVLIHVKLQGLTPGKHGFRIHSVGKCEGDFESAGPIHNPLGASYGLLNPEGPMAGNLTNLIASSAGEAETEFVTTLTTIADGPEESLLDADGSALIILERADDHITEPDGNAGARIACGAIKAAK